MATTDAKPAITDESVPPIPKLKLPQLAFLLNDDKHKDEHGQAATDLLAGIEADEMAPYLEAIIASSLPVTVPDELLGSLQAKNKEQLDKFDQKLEDAKANLGDSEVSDTLKQKATYLARIGHKEVALMAYEVALEKAGGLGSKIDFRLAMIRIGLFHSDHQVITSNIDAAQLLVDEGGDWDRRNRLKAYQGVYMLSIRNFKKGGELLLDVLSTFTATELVDYDDFVVLAVLAGVLTLERKDLKKKIIDSPEVISILPTNPALKEFFDSLYTSAYARFFRALAVVETSQLLRSRLLSVHAKYYVREMRIKAYAQLLESYRSVTLKNLADAFGVGTDFIDADLSRFITAGRLNCRIDRVKGIVETNRPDAKNARYEAVVKQGDVLLTAVQRLSRVIG